MVWLSGIYSQNSITMPRRRSTGSLSEQIAQQIRSGQLARGERLPATRELAGLLGLNRTTVSAAYEILEAEGLISGQVGRGSFVTGGAEAAGGVDWTALLERTRRAVRAGPTAAGARTSSASRFRGLRATCFRWTSSAPPAPRCWPARDLADILQLGSPSGYEPLRRYLLEEARRQQRGRSGRRPADHQRLPAGAGPDRPRAAAAGRHGGGGRSGLHRPEESADRDGRATLRNSGGRRRHGSRRTWSGCWNASGRASWW